MASSAQDLSIDDGSDVTSEAQSTPSFPAFSVGDTSSQTSYSVRSSSPAPSVLSMTSSMRAQAFILEYGRGINNNSEIYRLPADDEEIERLQKQHLMFREVLGKYPSALAEVLADDTPGETKACLDLGCGSGGWIMEVAVDFPNCTAVGVDLVPLQSIHMPPNCRSEVDDVNLGLEHYYGDFNVVHVRLIAAGIRDYPALINHISRVLRPGGLIHLAEFDFHIYDDKKERYLIETSNIKPPWWPLWMEFSRLAVGARGAYNEVSSSLVQWVSEHGAFENVTHQVHWIPMSPWVQGDDSEAVRQRWIGELALHDVLILLKSARPLLLGSGLSETLLDEVESNAAIEMKEAKVPNYLKVVEVQAFKRH